MGTRTEAATPSKHWIAADRVVSSQSLKTLLFVSSLFFLISNFCLLFFRNIHWDEFLFLSRIYRYQDGTLTNPLQTLYVHLFSWLPWLVAGDEINQILVGRVICFSFFLGTLFLTYQVAQRFMSPTGALLVLLSFSSFYEVLEHVGSFRIESLSTFLFLLVLRDLLRGGADYPRARSICYGLVMAVSLLLTTKSVFHVLCLGLIILRRGNSLKCRQQLRQLLWFGISGVLCFSLLFLLHRAMLTPASIADIPPWIGHKLATLFEIGGRNVVFIESVYRSPMQWLLIFVGLLVVARRVTRRGAHPAEQQTQVLLLFSFLLFFPLLIYRNSWGYFYPFILSPAILLCGVPATDWEQRSQEQMRGKLIALLGLFIVVLVIDLRGLGNLKRRMFDGISPQRQVISVVHRMFPDRVPYLDRSGMIATFPRVGPMISTLVLEEYHRNGVPMIKTLLAEKRPVFVLVNTPTLEVFPGSRSSERSLWVPFLEEDQRVLRENFIHHWGPIYVAGKEFLRPDKSAIVGFEVLIAGEYLVESMSEVVLDGKKIKPQTTVDLSSGEHSIIAADVTRLRWGRDLFLPPQTAPSIPLFHGY